MKRSRKLSLPKGFNNFFERVLLQNVSAHRLAYSKELKVSQKSYTCGVANGKIFHFHDEAVFLICLFHEENITIFELLL